MKKTYRSRSGWCSAAAAIVALGAAVPAYAIELPSVSDWSFRWDNTLQYNLGIRAQSINSNIGNNPVFNESDYKFSHAGDIVTNRISDLSEFDVVYQGNMGLRISGSGWKDFAYDSNVKFNPGNVAPAFPAGALGPGSPAVPATPYSALSSYSGNTYSAHTKRFYETGGQLLDAFTFANFDLLGHPTSIKVGRLTQYWGNALFFGSLGINYSQSPSDLIKASAAPGTQAKELALPRTQATFSTQITPTLSFTTQYFAEYYGNRLPEGGTYLGIVDFLFDGPNQAFGSTPHGVNYEPTGFHGNYGFNLRWSPEWLVGTAGVYYRHFDETQPWNPLFAFGSSGATNYHLSYATNVQLIGLSLDKQIGNLSTGFEVSYRQRTGLFNNSQVADTGDLAGREGPRGNAVNVIANVLAGLTPTPLYDTGTALAEVAYVHKISVTSHAEQYQGVGTAACVAPGGGPGRKWDGCATNNAVGIAGLFDPQWLQVFPGVDLDAPLFAIFGIYGNGATLGVPAFQGDLTYTAGIHAFVRQRYNVTLQYNGYAGRHDGVTNTGASNGIPNGTPGFPEYWATGNNSYMLSDRGWISLALSTTF